MASLTQWSWVWVSSGSWWWTGKPGVYCSPRGHKELDMTERLNWTELLVAWLSNWTELMVGLLANTKRAHAKVPLPGLQLPVSPSLWWAPADLHLYREPSNTSRQVWFGLLWGQCFFPQVLVHTRFCALQECSLHFPQSYGSPAIESYWPQCQIPWGFLVPLPNSQIGKPDLGFRTFPIVRELCGTIVFQFVGCPPSKYEVWFFLDCVPSALSLWFLLCLWTCGTFFGGFQCLPVNDCSTVICDFGTLTGGGEHVAFYSTILKQSPACFIFKWCCDIEWTVWMKSWG